MMKLASKRTQLSQMVLGFLLDIHHALFHQYHVISRIGVAATVEGVI